MLEFIEVNKIYNNDVCALKDLSFRVEDGEFIFLIGASGAGKTSIIKMLLREIKPSSGEIIVDNVNIVKLRNRKIPELRKTMGVVFQILGVSKKEITRRVNEILELVGLSDRASSFPNQLSGGEQQRICIARALVNRPKYLIADEPTGNLDPNTSEDIMKLLLDVNAKGTTVIVSTHDKDIVNKLKKRVICMDHGEMINDEERGGYFDEFN